MTSTGKGMADPTLTNYRIDGKLGAGGMGVVYSAHDLRLRRDVALKILPADFAEHPERMERFRREAQSLASLNHPNIVTIYSVEEENGTQFITMERVRGRTLDVALPDEGFPLKRFLDLAIQLTDGMAAAEKAGITHRDLKPANVMISDDGRIKIIDLGLAKLIQPESPADSLAPTVAATVSGGVVGTPAYMSPEQIEGRPVDHRSDIFSLGVLFFEMLTGRRPFAGANSVSLMSSILRDDARPVSELRAGVPPELVRIVRRCLEKVPDERFQSALDLRNALRDVQTDLQLSESGQRPALRRQSGIPLGKVVPAVLAVLVAGLLVFHFTRNRSGGDAKIGNGGGEETAPRTEASPALSGEDVIPPPVPAQAHRWSSADAIEKWPRLSPDGTEVAFAMQLDGFFQIFVRPVEGGQPRAITDAPLDHIMPAWSPDGQRIAYVQASGELGEGRRRVKIEPSDVYGGFYAHDGDVWIARSDGGDARLLAERAFSPTFRPDGTLAFNRTVDATTRIWSCDANGRGMTAITPNEDSIWHVDPSWSSDGEKLVYRRQVNKYGGEITVLNTKSGERHTLTSVGLFSEPTWSPDGRLVYYVANAFGTGFNIFRIQVDEAGRRAGEPQQVTFGPGPDINPTLSPDGDSLFFAVVPWNSDLWILPVDPESGDPKGEPSPLISSTGEDSRVAFSADESVITFCSTRDGEMSIYAARFDPESATAGPPVRVTEGGFGGHYQPTISADGRQIAYFGRIDGNEDIFRVSIGEELRPIGNPVRLTEDPSSDHSPFISPDGRHIVFRSDRSGGDELWFMNSDGSNLRQVTNTGAHGHFTPWYDDASVVVKSSDVRDVIPDRSSVTLRLFLDGREPEVLGTNGGGHISLSPNREWIAENDHKVMLKGPMRSMVPDETEIYRFPNGAEVDYTVWSPSGRWIAVDCNTVRGGDIYRLPGMKPKGG